MIFENPTPEICQRKLIKSLYLGVSNLDLDGFPSILIISRAETLQWVAPLVELFFRKKSSYESKKSIYNFKTTVLHDLELFFNVLKCFGKLESSCFQIMKNNFWNSYLVRKKENPSHFWKSMIFRDLDGQNGP